MGTFYKRKDVRLIIMCALVVVSHTAVSFFEEELFKRQGFKEGFFMMFVLCLQYSVLHTIARPWIKGERTLGELLTEAKSRKLLRSLVLLCVAYAGSNAISKMALGFVTIPTQIVFKSCKLVAVMLGSGVILGKTYSMFEYFIASLLVIGMICFAGADISSNLGGVETNIRTLIGCLMLCTALCCDSILGNIQEKVQKGGLCDELSLMYIQSVFGTGFLLIFTAVSGELSSGASKCLSSVTVMVCLNAWSLLNMFGIIVMLKVAGEYSAVTAVLTSSVRKFASLIVSYIFFPKRLTPLHGVGLSCVFGAIFLHTRWKQNKKKATAGDVSLNPTSPYEDMNSEVANRTESDMEAGRLLGGIDDNGGIGAGAGVVQKDRSFKLDKEVGAAEEKAKLLAEQPSFDDARHPHGK